GGIVAPRPAGYCSVASTRAPRRAAASTRMVVARVTSATCDGGMAAVSRSWTSITRTAHSSGTSLRMGPLCQPGAAGDAGRRAAHARPAYGEDGPGEHQHRLDQAIDPQRLVAGEGVGRAVVGGEAEGVGQDPRPQRIHPQGAAEVAVIGEPLGVDLAFD